MHMEISESGYAYHYQCDLNLKATELRLGLPGSDPFLLQQVKQQQQQQQSSTSKANSTKRASAEVTYDQDSSSRSSTNSSSVSDAATDIDDAPPVAKAQIVGWPPVRSYRKNATLQSAKKSWQSDVGEVLYVKVSMDGAPYLRKIDLKVYNSYHLLFDALGKMFRITIGQYTEREGYGGSEYAPTYEDKDGDWMLVGDVPWEMFISSCKKLRLMKSSEAKGLGCP